MVDAAVGLLGIEWVEGKSVRNILPGGANEDIDEGLVSESSSEDNPDPLNDFGISSGMNNGMHITFLTSLRYAYAPYRKRNRKDAHGRHHSWRFDHL
jgi:hypothetical protein